jgi:hypothetical protein
MARNSLKWSVEAVGCSCVGLTLLILTLLAGCGRSTTTVGPKGEEATVTKEGGAVKVTGKDEHGDELKTTVGSGASLPDAFPSDVAIYPKATIEVSATVGNTMSVSLKTADSAKEVETFYKQKMKENGWDSKSSLDMPQMKMLEGSKKGHTLTVVISAESGHTIISLSVTSEK